MEKEESFKQNILNDFIYIKLLKQDKVITSVGHQASDYSGDGVRAGTRAGRFCLYLGPGYMYHSLCKSISHLSLFTLLNICYKICPLKINMIFRTMNSHIYFHKNLKIKLIVY